MSDSFVEIQKSYRRYRLAILAELLLLIGAVVFFFLNRSLILPVLAVAVFLHLVVARPEQKRYTRLFNEAGITKTVCPKIAAAPAKELGDGLITEELIKASYLMPCDNERSGLLLRWQLRGEKKNLKIALCDAVIPQNFRLKEKGKRRVHFNAGTWVHIELPKDTELNFQLLDVLSVPTPIRMAYYKERLNYESIPIEDPVLSERCVLYHRRGHDATLYRGLLRSYRQLLEYSTGYAAISVHGSKLDVFLRGRFLARPVTLKEKPSKELVAFDPLPELDYILTLARSLVS